jgi:hypothetical protein
MKPKRKVRYEFYKYDGTNPLQPRTYTLNLQNTAKVIFTFIGFSGDVVVINQGYFLNPVIDTNNGLAQYPSTLILENNKNEIDKTNYQLQITNGSVIVVCKYYVNE